ncbi:MAG: YbhB/YbcL family Raf kinase inhibitor-like protein [Methanomicrobiales archaeon]|nr:YbhB/YbcL family Raf kinase inhibitor-like protein [Methanomicrobiales archaeon]NYT21851.1 YbhB/YbcL family Raf kinase inhibitor-like protein [Methanomicrobiales archaeon]
MQTLGLTSPAFGNGDRIPAHHACTGKNDSPPLAWEAAPEGTASLALICEDPDCATGTFIHWILYNIPPGTTSLPAGIPHKPVLPDGAAQGMNDFGKMEYGGPCPPPGKPHHYFFRLYALDTLLHLRAPVTRKSVGAAMEGHVIARGELVGIFSR